MTDLFGDMRTEQQDVEQNKQAKITKQRWSQLASIGALEQFVCSESTIETTANYKHNCIKSCPV